MAYYNVAKPKVGTLHKVGEEVSFASKTGGGSYVVVGHINCNRCNTVIEEREVQEPNRRQRKNGSYHYEYSWCHNCGLYEPKKGTREVVINNTPSEE